MSDSGKVLFNEKCSVCNFEIKHYQKRSKLIFNDCSQMEDKYLKKLHVVFSNGKELIGIDAFIYIWERTNGYLWLSKLVRLPVIKQCSVFAYSVIAFLLFWRFKIFNRS